MRSKRQGEKVEGEKREIGRNAARKNGSLSYKHGIYLMM